MSFIAASVALDGAGERPTRNRWMIHFGQASSFYWQSTNFKWIAGDVWHFSVKTKHFVLFLTLTTGPLLNWKTFKTTKKNVLIR